MEIHETRNVRVPRQSQELFKKSKSDRFSLSTIYLQSIKTIGIIVGT